MMAGRILPEKPLVGKVTNHHTVITPEGDEIALPPDYQSGAERESAPPPCSWSGYDPPDCSGNTGAFRRVYNPNFVSGGDGYVTTYDNSLTLPPNIGEDEGGDTGYDYIEGWPASGPDETLGSNSEGGIYFVPACLTGTGPCADDGGVHNAYYRAYVAEPGGEYYYGTHHFTPGDTMLIDVSAGDSTSGNANHIGVIVYDTSCPTTENCNDLFLLADYGWTGPCCIMARMTTIAQDGGDNFTSGEEYGPQQWYSADLGGGTNPYGYQCWPKDESRVIVDFDSETQETDTIDLHTGTAGPSCPPSP
jgi:hypothetical protein